MAKKIIITTYDTRGMKPQITAVYWMDVPLANQANYAKVQEGVSTYVDATQAELDAIDNGEIYERVETHSFDASDTPPTIRAALEARHAKLQAAVNADTTYQFFGAFWDGSSWTNP